MTRRLVPTSSRTERHDPGDLGHWHTGRVRDAFTLDPAVTHLNHGSFGAVPRVVQEEQQRLRDRAQANPMRFFRVDTPGLKEQARESAAGFLGVTADELALVRNPTTATATVLSSLARQGRLGEGDVILLNEHSYGAVLRAADRWCAQTGASYDVVPLPVDARDDEVVRAYREAVEALQARGRSVRLAVVDEITSPLGNRLPVGDLVEVAHRAGAMVLVDAAHAPGHVPVDPAATGAEFWTGTWHKWAFAPPGTSALWVTGEHREATLPLTTSWNHGEPFPLPFDATGSDDYTGWFALGAAIDFWTDAGGPGIADRSRRLLEDAVEMLDKAVAATGRPVTHAHPPVNPSPCMRMLALPDGTAATLESADALYQALSARGVEAQVTAHGGRGWIRLSASVYNDPGDYERLAEVLPDLLV
jgi:isopenicillin-N epimerase